VELKVIESGLLRPGGAVAKIETAYGRVATGWAPLSAAMMKENTIGTVLRQSAANRFLNERGNNIRTT
jgi:hypothetical protein